MISIKLTYQLIKCTCFCWGKSPTHLVHISSCALKRVCVKSSQTLLFHTETTAVCTCIILSHSNRVPRGVRRELSYFRHTLAHPRHYRSPPCATPLTREPSSYCLCLGLPTTYDRFIME